MDNQFDVFKYYFLFMVLFFMNDILCSENILSEDLIVVPSSAMHCDDDDDSLLEFIASSKLSFSDDTLQQKDSSVVPSDSSWLSKCREFSSVFKDREDTSKEVSFVDVIVNKVWKERFPHLSKSSIVTMSELIQRDWMHSVVISLKSYLEYAVHASDVWIISLLLGASYLDCMYNKQPGYHMMLPLLCQVLDGDVRGMYLWIDRYKKLIFKVDKSDLQEYAHLWLKMLTLETPNKNAWLDSHVEIALQSDKWSMKVSINRFVKRLSK